MSVLDGARRQPSLLHLSVQTLNIERPEMSELLGTEVVSNVPSKHVSVIGRRSLRHARPSRGLEPLIEVLVERDLGRCEERAEVLLGHLLRAEDDFAVRVAAPFRGSRMSGPRQFPSKWPFANIPIGVRVKKPVHH